MLKDYYAILGVPPSASGDEIRRAFKRLALLCHPDKVGGGAAAEATSIVGNDEQSLTAKWTDSVLSNSSFCNTGAPMTSSQVIARDFTDVQEAYEVLGDVARRYLYDMNYQELLALQQQRRQEEQRRCEAHARAVAEAARQARERVLMREQQQQYLQTRAAKTTSALDSSAAAATFHSDAPCSSPPQNTALPNQGRGATATSIAVPSPLPAGAPQENPPRQPPEPVEEAKEDDCSQEGMHGDVSDDTQPSKTRYNFTAPVRSLRGGIRPEGCCRAKKFGVCDTSEGFAQEETQTQISSSKSRLARKRAAANVPAEFALPSTLLFSLNETPAQTWQPGTEPSHSRRRHWRRHTALRDREEPEEPELPLEYYYRRSIERTLRIFFGVSNPV
ncbi:hypothetical protein JKF63_01404 [Porcisia hertigi]|uniref:J domain-containing protein n=1 Tax=Porcisia hertigi TaxID=2761500 RepID=A0A836HHL3_9TRYP|nr:hypothetical protein JKF63_01404 [Porcisia hertigi]